MSEPIVNTTPNPAERAARVQPLVIRLSHWINVPLIVIMSGSGLQILMAYPYMGPRGAPYRWYPLQGWTPPEWLRLGDWLAGARALHFAFGWFLAANGFIYVAYLCASGEWRRRMFLIRRDLPNAIETLLFYLRIRKMPAKEGLYNGLQRLGYTSAVALGGILVLSGLAIWKPTQLEWLAGLFGGYDPARVVHLLTMVALAVFAIVHVLLVSLHPKTIVDMVLGGPKERRGSHS